MSLYGTGATPSQLQQGYANNLSYQRPARAVHPPVVEDLRAWEHAAPYLGRERHYPDFLAYFQRAMTMKTDRGSGSGDSGDSGDSGGGGEGGWEAVLAEHALAGTPAADDLLVRLFAGILHPALQLMYGVEWRQPAIVAEALAQACVHQPDFKDLLLGAERAANERKEGGGAGEEEEEDGGRRMPRIVSLYEEIRRDPKLATAVRADDDDKIRGGLLKRAPGEMMRVLGKVKVRPEELGERTAEMFDAVLYATASASFHPGKVNKFDFYLM